MYHDRTAWRCAFFVGKNMNAAKDIHKEMLPIWTLFCSPNLSLFFEASLFFLQQQQQQQQNFKSQ
jgi:hypothetical protein